MISKKQCMLTVLFQCSLQWNISSRYVWVQSALLPFGGVSQPAERLGPKAAHGVRGDSAVLCCAVAAVDPTEGCSCTAQLFGDAAVVWCLSMQGWAPHSPPGMCPQQWPSTVGHCPLISVTVGTGSQTRKGGLLAIYYGAVVNPLNIEIQPLEPGSQGWPHKVFYLFISPTAELLTVFVLQASFCIIK